MFRQYSQGRWIKDRGLKYFARREKDAITGILNDAKSAAKAKKEKDIDLEWLPTLPELRDAPSFKVAHVNDYDAAVRGVVKIARAYLEIILLTSWKLQELRALKYSKVPPLPPFLLVLRHVLFSLLS